MASGVVVAKRRGSSSTSSSLFFLSCGCNDSKSGSVSDGSDISTTITPPCRRPSNPPSSLTLTSASSSLDEDSSTTIFCKSPDSSTQSFSGLLRQLGDLEQSVIQCAPPPPQPAAARRRRSLSGGSRVGESVAVVRETSDPMADFRRSMLQMIVEKEIVGAEELRELLGRFLALNSPRHHEDILRAFADIWDDVFAGLERTPEILRRCRRR